jgi:hypothetical protein
MPATKTVTKEELFSRIDRLSPPELAHVAELVNSLEEHEPNEETIRAMEDVKAGRNLSKIYNDVDEMINDLLKEANA